MKTVWFSEPVMRGLSLPRTNLSSSTGHLPFQVNFLQFVQIYVAIWHSQHFPKYIFPIQTNIYSAQTQFSTCNSTSTVCSLEKYVLMLHIWTNAFCNLDKSVVLHWTPAIPHSTFCHVSNALSKFWWGSSWGDVAWFSKKYFFTDQDWISQTVTFPNLSGRPFGTHRPVWGPWPEGLIQFD